MGQSTAQIINDSEGVAIATVEKKNEIHQVLPMSDEGALY
jgi:hypothetical protein